MLPKLLEAWNSWVDPHCRSPHHDSSGGWARQANMKVRETAELSWDSWRLHTLEARMEPWKHQSSRRAPRIGATPLSEGAGRPAGPPAEKGTRHRPRRRRPGRPPARATGSNRSDPGSSKPTSTRASVPGRRARTPSGSRPSSRRTGSSSAPTRSCAGPRRIFAQAELDRPWK